MCFAVGSWGVPDFGAMVVRDRVTRLIAASGTRLCLMHGPSGSGKSVAAAHFAASSRKPTFWIDANGDTLSARAIAGLILGAGTNPGVKAAADRSSELLGTEPFETLGTAIRASSFPDGICVVVDDLGMPSSPDVLADIRRVQLALRGIQSSLLVTTRSITGWPSRVVCDSEVVGPSDLALTLEEARDVAWAVGGKAATSAVETLRDTCSGHPAFFAVLAAQAREYGLESTHTRTASLDARLARAFCDTAGSADRCVLLAATILKSGTVSELASLGIGDGEAAIRRLARTLPLLSIASPSSARTAFSVHDLVDGFLWDEFSAGRLERDEALVESCVDHLTTRGDYLRAAELILKSDARDRIADWLEAHGLAMLEAGHYTALSSLIEETPIHVLMSHPRLLVLWGELCGELGFTDDALAKCRAARSLALHEGDTDTACRAVADSISCLVNNHRLDEADDLAREVLRDPSLSDNRNLQVTANLCVGRNRAIRGDFIEAERYLTLAAGLAADSPDARHLHRTAEHVLAILPAVALGDYSAAIRALSPMASESRRPSGERLKLRGNLASMLLEMGRLSRSESLLNSMLAEARNRGLGVLEGAYEPVLGCVLVGAGNQSEGLAAIREGIAVSIQSDEEFEADHSRVYYSVALRAAGNVDAALAEAESAFERFSVCDSMGFRSLAALEVAASLLSLGDVHAARAWTHPGVAGGLPGNHYHGLRADMILAEADRRSGDLEGAVRRLASHEPYILSENSNWQIAMYCRAFPELLGVFALAIGPDRLPAHMLRMILPEHAELSLIRSREFLDAPTWRALGMRLIGEEEFAQFIERDGMPLCHVRLFGGLDVTIGGRPVRERDWKKRKARLLFSMLMIRRGQDVPREQLFEYLWPEMDEARAKSNLYVIWSAMKSVLMGDGAEKGTKCPYVESIGGVCRAVRSAVRTDVDAFDTAWARGREAESVGKTQEALQAYQQLADLYRGDLLPGDCYDDWFGNLREHFRTEFIDAMLRATRILMDADDPGTALIYIRRAIQHDQFREDLYQAALRCQIAAGQRSSAIDTYMQCRHNLSEELGLDPSAETRALYDEILAMEDRPRPFTFDPLSD